MKILLFLILSTLLPIVSATGAESDTPATPTAEQQKNIDALVRDLMDEKFQVREQASKELWELGDMVLPALKEASKSSDPEQAFRARELVRKIQLHLTPGTDPAVLALVGRYSKATPTEKNIIIASMMEKRAWRQLLKLFASETQQDVRRGLAPMMEGVAVKAARESLSKGNVREARDLLEMAPAEPESLIALAEFHRTQGTLDVELERTKGIKGKKSQAWQLALQRAAGNLAAAREAANAAGETQIAAVMAALTGDPLPWLLASKGNAVDPEEEDSTFASRMTDDLSSALSAGLIKRWQNQPVNPKDLDLLTKASRSNNGSVSAPAMHSLFLLGETMAAEKAFVKSSPLGAFLYFDSLERIPEAFHALDLDLDHPDYKTWVEKRFKNITTRNIEDEHGVSYDNEELVALANFFERRGLHEEALAVFSGPLATFAETDANNFLEFLGKLFGERQSQFAAPMLAKHVGIIWAGDDDQRWDQLVASAFGDGEEVRAWWKWLADIAPDASRVERFEGMFALFRIGGDAGGLREKWMNLAWKQTDAAPMEARVVLLERISSLCTLTGDVASALKAWDQLPEASRAKTFWGEGIFYLSAAERWNDAANLILKQIDDLVKSKEARDPGLHAYAAAALRKAGRPADAVIHDQWAEKLALGDASISIQIGNAYAFGLDYARADEWWGRAAREAAPGSQELATAFRHHADSLMKAEKWKETAAVCEVLSRMYVSSDDRMISPLLYLRIRLQADMARAVTLLKTDRSAALRILTKCHQAFAGDGSLADFFFPTLRKVGLIKEHDAWFDTSWNLMTNILKLYPESDNTLNTAAWFASRSLRKLDEAESYLTKALDQSPDQSAYLDTMAEIQFAKGNRGKALEWSKKAVYHLPIDPQLREQQERFRSDPFPK